MKKYKIILSAAIMVLMFGCSQQSEPLSIAFWNAENLFDLVDDPHKNDEEFALGGKKKITRQIYDLKMKHSAEVLKDLDAHIVGLCEVENRFVLEELNNAYSERDYSIIHFDSPDERGIDVALLYDPEYFRVTASRAINNPLPDGDVTRDILYVEGKYAGKTLHIFINHWPSNWGGVAESKPKRAATATLLVKEVRNIMNLNPAAEIIFLGDFNENPNDEHVRSLKTIGLTSLMLPLMDVPGTGTYVYDKKDYFYDQVIVSYGLQDGIDLTIAPNSLMVLDLPKYRQQKGKYAHYPFRFWAGNRLLGGYSDHLAVKVEIIKK